MLPLEGNVQDENEVGLIELNYTYIGGPDDRSCRGSTNKVESKTQKSRPRSDVSRGGWSHTLLREANT